MSEIGDTIAEEGVNALKKKNSRRLSGVEQLPENFHRNFLSEPIILIHKPDAAKKVLSDPNFAHEINYDDLCGPWSCPEIPAYQKYDVPLSLVPEICTWIFIEESDMIFMKQFQDDKEAIQFLIGNKIPNNILFSGTNKDIFLQLMWEVFRFARDNGYTEISTSSLLGLFYSTHRYFLATPWRTTTETYEFFKEGILLHSVSHPPKSVEIFTFEESKRSLDLFWTLYMRQLPLMRFTCLPNYRLILTIEKDSPSLPREEEEEEEINK